MRLHGLLIQEATSFFTSQSPLQRRLGVYNSNPGPRRGTEGAIEKQIAGKWHLVTLQEASDYVDHAILHERFYVTHFAGCAVPFNEDTFLARSFSRRRTGLGLQGVVSRASFLRVAASGQTFFAVLSLHISNVYAKKRHCQEIIQATRSLMISQDIHLVAGEFNGAAWLFRSRGNLSSIDEAFADCALPTPPGTPPMWGPGSIPINKADVCGFLKRTGSQRFWKVDKHGVFSILRQALGVRANDQNPS